MHSGNYGKKQLQGLQQVMKWAQDKEMTMRGHTLVWGNLQPWSNELAQAGQKEDILAFLNRNTFIMYYSILKGSSMNGMQSTTRFVFKKICGIYLEKKSMGFN